jgi:hypothetical protein
MISQFNGDQLHRLVKLAMDTGEAQSIAEAKKQFDEYCLTIQVGPEVAESSALQACLLTAVNTGRRCFLGGVEIVGNLEVPLRIPWKRSLTLSEAVIDLQGKPVKTITSKKSPCIHVGNSKADGQNDSCSIKAVVNGWYGGVLPLEDAKVFYQSVDFTPAGVLAGALGVSEAFQYIRGDTPLAGNRSIGLSLWNPGQTEPSNHFDPGPELAQLPSKIWLIGLGHLGQAYLWTLGFLPYKNPGDVELVLQDFDKLVEANDSTSLLTDSSLLGFKKTRAMAVWCEERGFKTNVLERRFGQNFRVDNEPQVALCGVDNALARSHLEDVGFKRIIEAGLGKGIQEYLGFQIHTFPSSRKASQYWSSKTEKSSPTDALIKKPAYQALALEGYEKCGLTELAGRSVGASFVGAVISTIVIAEMLRIVLGKELHEVIDGDLRNSNLCTSVLNEKMLEPFNPGVTSVIEM